MNTSSEWHRFREEIDSARRELQHCATEFCEIWYRGQVRSSWDLVPSLFRGFNLPISRKREKASWIEIWEQEQDLYYEFAARARQLHGPYDDWDILFAMQHFGVPTRLLDWTETFGVGLYFALHDFARGPGLRIPSDKNDPPCIWVLNPYELNWKSDWHARDLFDPKNLGWDEPLREFFGYSELLLEGGMDWDKPVAVYPRQRTDRMQAQRGWFTMSGDVFSALNKRKDWSYIGRKIILPTAAFDDAHEFLDAAGLGLFTLFPDLPNLAAELKQSRDERVFKFHTRNNKSRPK